MHFKFKLAAILRGIVPLDGRENMGDVTPVLWRAQTVLIFAHCLYICLLLFLLAVGPCLHVAAYTPPL